jgi:hypothetical protein
MVGVTVTAEEAAGADIAAGADDDAGGGVVPAIVSVMETPAIAAAVAAAPLDSLLGRVRGTDRRLGSQEPGVGRCDWWSHPRAEKSDPGGGV